MLKKLLEDRAFALALAAGLLVLGALLVIWVFGWIIANPGWTALIVLAILGAFAVARANT